MYSFLNSGEKIDPLEVMEVIIRELEVFESAEHCPECNSPFRFPISSSLLKMVLNKIEIQELLD